MKRASVRCMCMAGAALLAPGGAWAQSTEREAAPASGREGAEGSTTTRRFVTEQEPEPRTDVEPSPARDPIEGGADEPADGEVELKPKLSGPLATHKVGEIALSGGWHQVQFQGAQFIARTQDESPVGTPINDLAASENSFQFNFVIRGRNLLSAGPVGFDLTMVEAGAQLSSGTNVALIHLSTLGPSLYVNAGRMRIGVGASPELQIANLTLAEIGSDDRSNECRGPGECESALRRDDYFQWQNRQYDSGSSIQALSLAFAARAHARVAIDINDSFGVALVAGYRFLGTHDDYDVTVTDVDDDEGFEQELPSGVFGGGGIPGLDARGFGASLELFYRAPITK